MAKKETTKTVKHVKCVECKCPTCGHITKVPGNGLYHCFECGEIFSVDLAPMTSTPEFRQDDSCGASVAAWIIDDMGLFPIEKEKILSKLAIRKNIPFCAWMDGTFPWTLTRLIRSRGADVELVDVRSFGRGFTNGLDFNDDERLIIGLVVDGTPHWVGCRKIGGSVKIADSLGTVTWKDIKENRGPMLVYKVSRRLHYCPLRMA